MRSRSWFVIMRSRNLIVTVIAVLVVCAAVQPALAQWSRTLLIRDGRVYVDGRLVPPQQLPASLDVEGIDAHYSFSGDLKPILALGGGLFTVEDGTLREVADKSQGDEAAVRLPRLSRAPAASLDVMRPLRESAVERWNGHVPGKPLLPGRRGLGTPSPDVAFTPAPTGAFAGPVGEGWVVSGRAFQDGDVFFAGEAGAHVEFAAEIARQASPMDMQEYLHDLERQNRALFDRLVAERDREVETIRLAQEIRQLADGPVRDARIADLRARLQEIFELKQENRRREIRHLERELAGLQERLRERERLRDEIVEERLRYLLESARP